MAFVKFVFILVYIFPQENNGEWFEITLDRLSMVASFFVNGEIKGTSADLGLHLRMPSLVVEVPNNDTVAVVFRSGFTLLVNRLL